MFKFILFFWHEDHLCLVGVCIDVGVDWMFSLLHQIIKHLGFHDELVGSVVTTIFPMLLPEEMNS